MKSSKFLNVFFFIFLGLWITLPQALYAGGYVDGEEELTASSDTSGQTFNNEFFSDQNLNSLVNNDLIRTPSTSDPISTVTGNMYHDEVDFSIRGRGLNYTFTRTYNSNKTKPETQTTLLSGTATASGADSGAGAANAFDGNDTTSGWWNSNTTSGWLKLDLGAGNSERVTQIRFKAVHPSWTAAGIKDFTFEGSNDDTNWTVLLNGLANDDRSAFQSFDVTNFASFRYYRINITSSHNNLHIGLWEAEFIADVEIAGSALPLSPGWTHSYNIGLKANDYGQFPNYPSSLAPENGNGTTSSITFTDERGGDSNFLVDDITPTWAVSAPSGQFDSLALDTGADGTSSLGYHTITFRNGTKYVFFSGNDLHTPGQTAPIHQIVDPYGNELNFGYDTNGRLTSITDNLGITGRTGLTLAYDGSDRLTSVSDWASRTVTYTYDAKGRLASATNALGHAITYTYDGDSDLLTEVILPADRGGQNAKATFSYYENGKAFYNANGAGDQETLNYDLYRKRTRVTDARGNVRTYFYDKNGAMTQLQEPDGGLLLFANSDNGLRYEKTDALGFKTQYSYHSDRSFGNQPSDNNGQVSKEQDALGNYLEYDYGIYDQRTRIRDKRGVIWVSEYFDHTDSGTGALLGKLKSTSVEPFATTSSFVQVSTAGGVATASGSDNNIFPSNAFDANDTTSGWWYSNTTSAWLKMDFGSGNLEILNRIRFKAAHPSWPAAGVGNFTFEGSNDNANWTVLHTDTAADDRTNYQQFDFANTTAFRYYRINFTSSHNNLHIGLWEMELYQETFSPLTIYHPVSTAGGVATASGSDNNIFPANAFDANDTTSGWWHSGNTSGWLKMDFGSGNAETLNRIRFKAAHPSWTAAGVGNFTFEGSNDDANWTVLHTDTAADDRTNYQQFDFANTTAFRYYRINFTSSHNNLHIGLWEMEFFENELNETVEGSTGLLSEFTYTPGGNIKTQINYFSHGTGGKRQVTTYTYDADDFNATQINVHGETFNGSNWVQDSITGPTRTLTHDTLGRVLTDSVDRVTSATDPTILSLTSTFTYDALGRAVTVTDPLDNIRRTVYDENGKVVSESVDFLDDNGTPLNPADDSYITRTQVTRTYDVADRLATESDIDGNTTTYDYDQNGNLISVIDANNHETRFEYDSMNRRTAVIDATGSITRTEYNLRGDMVRSINGAGNATTFTYDALGRQSSMTTPLGHTTVFTYDNNGNVKTITDPLGRVITSKYDAFNRTIETTGPDQDTTTFTYDLAGNRTSHTDAEGRVTTFIFDSLGRMVEDRDPMVQTPVDWITTYTYDELGNVLTKTDRNGETTRITYDRLNRVVKNEFLTDGTEENFTYDLFGELVETANESVTYQFTYDTQHRLTGKTDVRGTDSRSLAWTYDAVGNILTKTDYAGFVTTYQYNSADRLTAMRNSDHIQVSYFYDAVGRLSNRVLSNGAKSFYSYDADSRLTRLLNEGIDGVRIKEFEHSFDPVGNVTNITRITDSTFNSTNYTYDSNNRIYVSDGLLADPDTTRNTPVTSHEDDHVYGFDKVGNRLVRHLENNPTLTYAYNDNNQLLSVSDPTGIIKQYTYDANGNRIQTLDGAGVPLESYTWDQKNRLTSMTVGGVTRSFGYDPSNYRVLFDTGTGERRYYLEGEHLEMVVDQNDSVMDRYLRGVVIDEIVHGYHYDNNGSETALTYHHDPLKSVTSTLDRQGNATATSDYFPFGTALHETGTNPTGNRLRYTGREEDSETGLYYYRARYYDPDIGRFISEDPIGFAAGPNFYAYANNNPIRNNDPSGNAANWVLGGGSSVFMGWLLSKATGQDYHLEDAARDFVLGAAGVGILEKFRRLKQGERVLFGQKKASQKFSNHKDTPPLFRNRSIDDVAKDIKNGINSVENTPLSIGDIPIDAFRFQDKLVSINTRTLAAISRAGKHPTNINVIQNPSTRVIQRIYEQPLTNISLPGTKIPIGTEKNILGGRFFNVEIPSLAPTVASTPESILIGGSIGTASGLANGGFVIYPNKSNTNMMQSVYSK